MQTTTTEEDQDQDQDQIFYTEILPAIENKKEWTVIAPHSPKYNLIQHLSQFYHSPKYILIQHLSQFYTSHEHQRYDTFWPCYSCSFFNRMHQIQYVYHSVYEKNCKPISIRSFDCDCSTAKIHQMELIWHSTYNDDSSYYTSYLSWIPEELIFSIKEILHTSF
jgi:hypothetical protein